MTIEWKKIAFSGDIKPASEISVLELGTATYDDVQDFINNVQSSGRISGGVLSDDTAGGVDYTAITGMIKTSDSVLAPTVFFDIAAGNVPADGGPPYIQDQHVNYIYVDYNAGSPTVKSTITRSSIRLTDQFVIGRVWRDGLTINIAQAKVDITNFHRDNHERLIFRGLMEWMSGAVLSATGLTVACTAGIFYTGMSKVLTDEKLAATNFKYYFYRSGTPGVWSVTAPTNTLDNTNYDDGTGELEPLLPNRYCVHWIYISIAGYISVVYGRGDYTLALAQDAMPPGDLPIYIADFCVLAGKAIIQKSQSTLISLESVWEKQFTASQAIDHGSLSGLADDDHPQYLLADGSRTLTGSMAVAADKTIDGRDLSVDGSKLDGIAAGANLYVHPNHSGDVTSTGDGATAIQGIGGKYIYRADGTDVPIADGGTGQSTAQLAINALTAVSGATNEHVLTKDTATGNAIFKVAAGGGDAYVAKALFDANTFLAAVSDDTPAAVTVAEQRIVGRKTGGNIDDLTGAEVQTILAKYTSGLINLSLAASVGSKALTVALKGEDGADPSATNPVSIVFRDETLTTGTPNIRTVMAATSVVLSSRSTLDFTAAGRMYVWAIDNAGTVELALSRTADIFPESNLVSTTAEGGAGEADSATVMYSTTARSNVACRCIGYIEITTGAVPGEWDNAPTKIQVMGPGVKRTGDVVQQKTTNVSAYSTWATTMPYTSVPQITDGAEVMTATITPTSALNTLVISTVCLVTPSAASVISCALFMNAVASALAAVGYLQEATWGDMSTLTHSMIAATTSRITFRVRVGASTGSTYFNSSYSTTGTYGGVSSSSLTVTEVMA